MNQYYLPWRAGALYRVTHVHDGAQLVELTCVAFKLKLTFAPLVVMIRQVHGTFSASTNSTLTWVSENNPLTDAREGFYHMRKKPRVPGGKGVSG